MVEFGVTSVFLKWKYWKEAYRNVTSDKITFGIGIADDVFSFHFL